MGVSLSPSHTGAARQCLLHGFRGFKALQLRDAPTFTASACWSFLALALRSQSEVSSHSGIQSRMRVTSGAGRLTGRETYGSPDIDGSFMRASLMTRSALRFVRLGLEQAIQ